MFPYGFRDASTVYPKIYFGDPEGNFSEDNTFLAPAAKSGDAFSFNVIIPEGTQVIRFDPLEGKKALVKNLSFSSKSGILAIISTNGIATSDDEYWFETTDPQFIVNVSTNCLIRCNGAIFY